MESANVRRNISIFMVFASAAGIVSYFLPFYIEPKFSFGFSWFLLVGSSAFGDYIPIIFSVGGLVCSIMFLYGKEKMVYPAGVAVCIAAVTALFVLNRNGGRELSITVSHFSGLGYTLFMIAHCGVFLACAIYVFMRISKGGTIFVPTSTGEKRYRTKAWLNCGKPVDAGAAICPHCGKQVIGDFKFCPHCGKSNEKPAVKPVNQCRYCESLLDAGADFCRICGKPVMGGIPVKPRTETCPRCGRELPSGTSVCPVCSRGKSGGAGDGWYISDDLG